MGMSEGRGGGRGAEAGSADVVRVARDREGPLLALAFKVCVWCVNGERGVLLCVRVVCRDREGPLVALASKVHHNLVCMCVCEF